MSFSLKKVENLIDYLVVKNRTISKNIANIGTKGYRREDVVFKDVMNNSLKNTLRTTEEKHFKMDGNSNQINNKFQISIDKNNNFESGMNNVDIDREMSDLAETNLMYKFASKQLGDYFRNIQNVIRGRST